MIYRILIYIFVLCLGPHGCSKAHTYVTTEVVRSLRELRPDDRVEIALKDGRKISGQVASVEDTQLILLILFNDDGERQSISWEDVQTIRRSKKVRMDSY